MKKQKMGKMVSWKNKSLKSQHSKKSAVFYLTEINKMFYNISMIERIEATMWARRLSYRYLAWIQKRAIELDLVGKTFFRDDGSIDAIAEGAEENLAEFIEILRRGKFFAPHIENFSETWHEPTGEFKDFSVPEEETDEN